VLLLVPSCHVAAAGRRNERATLVTMITQAERAAEKRREKLEEIERQVKAGSLKIRKLTAKERKRFPPRPRKEPAKGARR
jgi:hypothetical protein